ncbi:MAG TPA: filamentous hemagglutinin N-terminal domain-containing protein, partial [Gammaproteobacteria bacterium]|nr:filamentous hemagglutinin N-terminal domain-containing protein [Gammaproteobacteria bacterium]
MEQVAFSWRTIIPVVLAGVLITKLPAAEVVPDGQTGTVVDKAQNGVTLVDVARPNSDGVSRNTYSDFNVGSRGLILNNSDQVGVSKLGGALPPNRNYRAGDAARVILNEVTSVRRSRLEGYAEIFGARAEFVLANPNGITCNGCGFINTSRATLIAGSEIDPAGPVGSFRLGTGTISIQGLGLNGSNVDYVDIISRAADIQAEMQAGKRLGILTGNDRFDYASRKITSRAGATVSPAFAIDAGILGSMYASQIELVATEAGVGVRTQGLLDAQQDVGIDIVGDASLADIQGGSIRIRIAGILDQQGAWRASRQIDIEADTLALRDPVESDVDLRLVQRVGDWRLPGLRGGTGRTELEASNGRLLIDTPLYAAGDIQLSAQALSNRSTVGVRGNLNLRLIVEGDNAAGALLFAGQDLELAVGGDFVNQGELQAVGNLTAEGLSPGTQMTSFRNAGGGVFSGGDMSLRAGFVENTHNMPVDAPPTAVGQRDSFAIRVSDNYDWRTRTTNWHEERNPAMSAGVLQANGNLTIEANEVRNFIGNIFAAQDIFISADSVSNESYTLQESYTQSYSVLAVVGRECAGAFDFLGNCVGGGWRDVWRWVTRYRQAVRDSGETIASSIHGTRGVTIRAANTVSNVTSGTGVSAPGAGQVDPTTNVALPGASGLFRPNPAPDREHPYLIETNPQLIDVSSLYGSSYFLSRIDYQPENDTVLFLGDALYDQRLIADQIRTLLGQRFLYDDIQDENSQYRRLVDQAAQERERLDLAFGEILDEEQIAGLEQTILWYEKMEYEGQTVYVPRLYLAEADRERAAGRGATLQGKRVTITAADLANDGLLLSETALAIDTTGDLVNDGGRLEAGTDMRLSAGGTLRSTTRSWQYTAGADIRSGTGGQAAIEAGGNLYLAANGDIRLTATDLMAGGDAVLASGGNLRIDTLKLVERRNWSRDGWNNTENRVTHAGSQLRAGGAVKLASDGDLILENARLVSGGETRLDADGAIQILAARDSYGKTSTKVESGGWFSGDTVTTINREKRTFQGSEIAAGGKLRMQSGSDTWLVASSASSGGDASLATRQGNINLIAGIDSDYYRYQRKDEGFIYTENEDRGYYRETLAASTLVSDGTLRFYTGRDGQVQIAGAEVQSRKGMQFGGETPSEGEPVAAGDYGYRLDETDAGQIGSLRVTAIELNEQDWSRTSKRMNGWAAAVAGVATSLTGTGFEFERTDVVETARRRQQGADVASGGDLGIYARNDIVVSASSLRAEGRGTLDAGGDILVEALADEEGRKETHSRLEVSGISFEATDSRVSVGLDGQYRKTELEQSRQTLQQSSLRFGGDAVLRSKGDTVLAGSTL